MAIYDKAKPRSYPIDASLSGTLTDARLQLHQAAQLVAAIGISYLAKRGDDSHTNMEWSSGTLASNLVGDRPFRLGVRPHPLALVVIAGDAELASFALDGHTINDAATWVRARVQSLGLDPARYTLAKHYTIPTHAVALGAPFDATNAAAFEQLNNWFGGADAILRDVAMVRGGAAVRCWPHHFDIATLLTLAPGQTIGIGLEPGDTYYDEPYWYVNRYPSPSSVPSVALDGGGEWHSHDWIGAVLTGSRLSDGDQRTQVMSFIDSAIASLS